MSKLVLLRGLSTDLDSNSLVDGQILFTEDTNELYIDFLHPETKELIRKPITDKKLAEDLQQFINNLNKVENKSSEEIRNEITYENIIAALGFTPIAEGGSIAASNIDYSNTESGLNGTNVQAALDETIEKLAVTQAHVLTLDTEKASKEDVANAIADLVDSAPEEMNTIKELATEIENNRDVVELLTAAVGNKVDKVDGKDLSTNDYTTEEKEKLASIDLSLYATIAYVDEQINTHEHNLATEEDITNIINNLFN